MPQRAEEAFCRLMERYCQPVTQFVHQMVGSREDTQEVVQDIFVTAHGRIRQFAGRSQFKTWLFSIARNTSFDQIRKICAARQRDRKIGGELARCSLIEGPIAGPETGGWAARPGLRGEFWRYLIQLRERERTILMLRFDEELSLTEIAGVLEIGLSATKMRLARALRSFEEVYRSDRF